MAKKVIVAGHITMDVTPAFPAGTSVAYRELLTPGKQILVGAAVFHTGGAAANTGLAMKIFGADVRILGRVGADEFGGMVRKILREHAVDDGDLTIDPLGSTGYTIVVAPPGVDRIFLHFPGANDAFAEGDIPQAMLEEAALLHFGYPPLLKRMYQNDGRELVSLLKRAKDAGCATSLDMTTIDPSSAAGRANWSGILSDALPYTDFFVPSIEELGFALDRSRHAKWQAAAGDRDIAQVVNIAEDVRPLAQKCVALGARVVVVKCGAQGIYWCTAREDALQKTGGHIPLDAGRWAAREGFERSYAPTAVVSATGAGDTSIAAFLATMLEGCPPEECVRLAAAAGACCVESHGALEGLVPLPAMRRRIADGWNKAEA